MVYFGTTEAAAPQDKRRVRALEMGRLVVICFIQLYSLKMLKNSRCFLESETTNQGEKLYSRCYSAITIVIESWPERKGPACGILLHILNVFYYLQFTSSLLVKS